MSRVLDVTRVLQDWRLTLAEPLGVLVIAVAINLSIFAVTGGQVRFGTGSAALILTVLLLGLPLSNLQRMTMYLPFALSFGVTRRAFYAATLLFCVAQSVFFGLVVTVGSWVQDVTNGWGAGLNFWPSIGDPFVGWPLVSALFLVLAAGGMFIGAVHARWSWLGVGLVVLGIGGISAGLWAFFTSLDPDFVQRVLGQDITSGLMVGALLAFFFGGGWLAIRRTTA